MARNVAQRCGDCFNTVLTLFLFILEFIVPTLTLALVIPLNNDYTVTKIALTISTCLLVVIWFIVGAKLWTDYYWIAKDDSSRYGYDTDKVYCANPAKIQNLWTVGHLLYPAIPWTITNLAFFIARRSQLVSNDLWIIILGTVGTAYTFILGNCLGHALAKKYPDMGECFKRFISSSLYISLLSIPIFGVAIPIMTWNTYTVVWWTILVHACCLTLMGLILPIKIWTDCGKDYQEYQKNGEYSDHWCVDPAKFKSLSTGTFWLIFTVPWYFVVNVVCMVVWADTFIKNGSAWLVGCSVGAPLAMGLIGTAIGYGIFHVFYDYDEEDANPAKSSNPV